MRTSTAVLLASTAAGGIAARSAARRTLATWAEESDPTEGRPLEGPGGEAVEVDSHDGAVLRGVRAGEGPSVLLVHGWTGTTGHLAPVAHRLVDAGFEVVSVDQRGHGRSTIGSAGFTPEALGGDIASWVTGLGLDGAVLAGHSMGGLTIQSFAVEHPEVAARARALVLIATLAAATDVGREGPVMARLLTTSMPSRLIGRPTAGLFAMRNVVGQRPVRSHLEAARETYLSTHPSSIAEAYRMMMEVDLRPRLGAISVPTSFIVGTHDQLTSREQNEELASLIPGATIDIVDGAGHMLGWEAPERVADLIVQAHKPLD